MNDFNPCCEKRIAELTLEGRELSKLQAHQLRGGSVDVHVSGYCRTCGMALIFNHIHYAWEGELDLGTVSTEWIDRDSVVKPD